MSSHHIVREKQEPALLALNLDGFADELLGQLLEWSPTVIAGPGAAEKLEWMGIKVDWLLSDENATIGQPDVKLIRCTGSLIDAALSFLTENGYPSVNIISAENPSVFACYTDSIDLVIYNANKRIYPVRSGFSKWKPAGEKIEIYYTVSEPRCDGLKKTGETTYITVADGLFCIHFAERFLFLSEEI